MEIDQKDFKKEVIEKSKTVPVLVDFWAPWCGPCLILKPILEKLESEMNGRFVLIKINVDENQELAQDYEIMSIPNVKLFKNGKLVDEFLGARPKDFVKSWIEERI